MFDRRLLTHFDWVLLILVVVIAAIGIVNLYSATTAWPRTGLTIYYKQGVWVGCGLLLALGICTFDYRKLEYLSPFFYVGSLLLVGGVLVFGKTIMGAQRWIDLGFFNLQPSEVMKIVIILSLAAYFANHEEPLGYGLKALVRPLAMLIVPVFLIAKQPDLGTALLLLAIGGTMALYAGIRRRTLVLFGGLGLLACWGGWHFLHGYQRQRIMTFLNPESDPLGAGYHIIQSKIAVGSGGFSGKGYLEGTQSQLAFLPERHTDFAFSVFSEEWGFFGCLILLSLYLLLMIWGLRIADRAGDRFGTFVALGVVALLFWHATVNLGMVVGLLPVVGVPLPLFSYGGTSMVTTMIGIGLLFNVSMRRFVF